MKIITKKIEGDFETWSLANLINASINVSSRAKKGNKTPKKNTLEWELYTQKGCLLASKNEILDWLKEHNPTDKRIKNHIPGIYDDDKILWCASYNEFHEKFDLSPVRNIGKQTQANWEKELKSHKFGLTYFI